MKNFYGGAWFFRPSGKPMLWAEFVAGTSIKAAASSMLQLSEKHHVSVVSLLNGVAVVQFEGEPSTVARQYESGRV